MYVIVVILCFKFQCEPNSPFCFQEHLNVLSHFYHKCVDCDSCRMFKNTLNCKRNDPDNSSLKFLLGGDWRIILAVMKTAETWLRSGGLSPRCKKLSVGMYGYLWYGKVKANA